MATVVNQNIYIHINQGKRVGAVVWEMEDRLYISSGINVPERTPDGIVFVSIPGNLNQNVTQSNTGASDDCVG